MHCKAEPFTGALALCGESVMTASPLMMPVLYAASWALDLWSRIIQMPITMQLRDNLDGATPGRTGCGGWRVMELNCSYTTVEMVAGLHRAMAMRM